VKPSDPFTKPKQVSVPGETVVGLGFTGFTGGTANARNNSNKKRHKNRQRKLREMMTKSISWMITYGGSTLFATVYVDDRYRGNCFT